MIKSALKKVTPRALYPSSILRRAVQRKTNSSVIAGPFRGMKYLGHSFFGAYIPKLIGTYELELADIIQGIIESAPTQIIDIGGAEGYYAVGLLMRLPGARLTVFEQQEPGRAAIAKLASINGVSSRLEIRGSCTPDALNAALSVTSASLVIADVEGYEVELLDPERCPLLQDLDLLVEVHDFKIPGCSQLICDRFSTTHQATVIPQRKPQISEYPFRTGLAWLLPGAVLKYGLNEFRRPGNWWVWLERRNRDRVAS